MRCSTMSVPRVRMMPASMPASTAPMLRPIRRGGCVSFMTLSLTTPLLSPSRKLPATPRGSGLFVAQGFDGVELGGFHSGPDTEDETDVDADDNARGGGPHRHAATPLQGHADEQHEAIDEQEGDDAAYAGKSHGLEQELPGDITAARADRFAHANFAGALGDAHEHDVHDADAADEQTDAAEDDGGDVNHHHDVVKLLDFLSGGANREIELAVVGDVATAAQHFGGLDDGLVEHVGIGLDAHV